MALQLSTSPHVHIGSSVSGVMLQVLVALLPGIVVYVWFFGWSIVVNILLASVTALVCEALMLWLRKRPLKPFLLDGSAIVMAWLLALALPPLLPWWMTVLGVMFGLIFAKHLYGGLGYNPFNPAMVGYVVLIISFPVEMTQWLAPAGVSGHHLGILDSASFIFTGASWSGITLDAVSSATMLDVMKVELAEMHTVEEIQSSHDLFEKRAWAWLSLGFLIGGVGLLAVGVISWHIPVAMLGSLGGLALIFYLVNTSVYPSPVFHLLGGASILGAFFIATDPVSAATTTQGRLIYGALIGVLVYVIRTWGGYPDGIAFAVLLANMAVPMIDYYTQPRVFGH